MDEVLKTIILECPTNSSKRVSLQYDTDATTETINFAISNELGHDLIRFLKRCGIKVTLTEYVKL